MPNIWRTGWEKPTLLQNIHFSSAAEDILRPKRGGNVNIVVIAGARPNFMKVAPVLREFVRRGERPLLVHTGQHYDQAMSHSIFADLGLPTPDANLEVGSGSHAVQTARVMERFDAWMDEHPTDLVVVVGDVNSSVACGLVAVKRDVAVAHVEAGLRSRDRTMPEEINRLIIDTMSRWLLTPSPDADANLLAEGIHPGRIRCVGNIMADSLFLAVDRSATSDVVARSGITGPYALVTLHRPALVDDPERLADVLATLGELSAGIELLWPVHPRTRGRIAEFGLSVAPGIQLIDPLGYLDFVRAQANATMVLTDSGGVQEETTMLGIPCLTLRNNTERPITITEGTNTLVGFDRDRILQAASAAIAATSIPRRPALWDGRTAERIADVLLAPDGLSPVPEL